MEKNLDIFHILNKSNEPVSVFDDGIVQDIIRNDSYMVIGSVPYIYKNGVYHPDINGVEVKAKIKEHMYRRFIRADVINRVYNLFISEVSINIQPVELNAYPSHWINFQNGFYDPVAHEIIPHSPKYHAVNQIPHEYNPTSKVECVQLIDEWLNYILPDPDDREMLLQYCGYCLTRDTRQQKFMILCGQGGSGKSTLIRLLESVVGSDNICHVSLKELTQRFASYELLGKLLNSCADLEVGALEDTSIIKKILGEDSIRGEPKGKQAVSFFSYARLIFSTNELPTILNEKSNGFYRRLLILRMDRKPQKVDPYFMEKLEAGTEYFVRLAVESLERMYENGVLAESANSLEAVNSLWGDSDTVKAWLDSECRIVKEQKERPTPLALFTNYEYYCECAERTPLKRLHFYKSLKAKGFDKAVYEGREYYKGIELINPLKTGGNT